MPAMPLRRGRRADPPRPAGLSAGNLWIERLLEASATKALVVLLIAGSLLPQFDRPALQLFLFLPAFGVEFALRLRLFAARRRSLRRRLRAGEPIAPGERRPFEPLLLLLDLVAVCSFLPLGHLLASGRLLRLARLVRLVMVVRYAADLLRDFSNRGHAPRAPRPVPVLLLTVGTLSFVSAALLVYARARQPAARRPAVRRLLVGVPAAGEPGQHRAHAAPSTRRSSSPRCCSRSPASS